MPAILATGLLFCSEIHAGWTPLTNTPPGGAGIQMLILLSDGTVMAQLAPVGTTIQNQWYRLTPDSQGSYSNGTWTTLSPSIDTRLFYSSQVLRDGRVLTAGGEYGTGGSAAEIYDPQANTWTATPAPGVFLSDSISKVLPNGTVLVAPASGSITRIYDPVANTWSAGPTPINPANQNEVTWLKLPDDSILTVPTNSQTSQRFIPSLNQWIADGPVGVNLYSSVGSEIGGAFLLDNGDAFFIGGDNTTALYTPTGNNTAGQWRAGPTIPNVRDSNNNLVAGGAPDAGACMMVNGRILCSFSPQMFANPNPPPPNVFPSPTSFAIYDRVANAFTIVNGPTGPTVNVPSYQNLMLALPNGQVLYSNYGAQLYVYSPDVSPAPLAVGKPTINSITANADGSYHLTGTKLNGISEGASYGDDVQMDTNYPLVRLTSGSNVYYARTYGWSSRGVQTANAVVSTEFTLPPTIAEGGGGTYSLVVVANGISSDPVTFAGPVWVDFVNYGVPFQFGTKSFPYRTLAQGITAVSPTGTILMRGPATSPASFVTPPITKAVTILSIGGASTVLH